MTAPRSEFRRYALYFVPEATPQARFGAAWLGWDIAAGRSVTHLPISGLPLGLEEITQTPRRYGFHGTIVPPFRLREGHHLQDLRQHLTEACRGCHSVTIERLELAQLGRFLALVPMGGSQSVKALAAQALETCDRFRAPPSAADLERHRAKGLNPAQEALLDRWGYPYVKDQFRFHMTLTGKLPKAKAREVKDILTPHLAPLIAEPVSIDHLALVGEDQNGFFHLIEQLPLGAPGC